MKLLHGVISSVVIMALTVQVGRADLFPTTPPEASAGPDVGRPYQDLASYGKPDQMADILPNRPVAAHDQSGNRLFYSPSGKLMLTIALDGTETFSINNKTVTRDAHGKIKSVAQLAVGDNHKLIITDGDGNVTGTQTLNSLGQETASYDANGNLTQLFTYNQFGKKVASVLNVMSMTKTVYDNRGLPSYEVNFEGAKCATYVYDPTTGRLAYKLDSDGSKTFFTREGRTDYTEGPGGAKLAEYIYKVDAKGNSVLDHTLSVANDLTHGDITYYKDGKPQYTVSNMGDRVTDYQFNGDILIYTFDHRSQQTTYYDKTGRAMFASMDDNKVEEWIYDSNGRMMGLHDLVHNTLTIYQYERQAVTLQLQAGTAIPTGDQLAKAYQDLSPQAQTAIQDRVSGN